MYGIGISYHPYHARAHLSPVAVPHTRDPSLQYMAAHTSRLAGSESSNPSATATEALIASRPATMTGLSKRTLDVGLISQSGFRSRSTTLRFRRQRVVFPT